MLRTDWKSEEDLCICLLDRAKTKKATSSVKEKKNKGSITAGVKKVPGTTRKPKLTDTRSDVENECPGVGQEDKNCLDENSNVLEPISKIQLDHKSRGTLTTSGTNKEDDTVCLEIDSRPGRMTRGRTAKMNALAKMSRA